MEGAAMNRMERIKNRLFEKEYYEKKVWWGDEETILVSDEIKSLPLIIRKALAIRYVAQNMPAAIKPDELIVGVPTMASVGFGKTFPKYTLPEEDLEASHFGFTAKSVPGHHILNYETVLKKGLKGIRHEVMQKLDDASDEETINFYRSVLISLEALRDLAVRYTDLALEAAVHETDQIRRRELYEIAEVCTKVPDNPPESFHEALQSVWFVFALCHSTLEFIPVGRSDQYLYPYYKKDIESGKITREFAAELAGSFMAKFGERIFVEAGFPIEDARDYSNDGCWECIIPGRTNFGFCMLQVLQLLEYLLQGGWSLVRGQKEVEGIPALDRFQTYDEFYAEFLRLLRDNLHKEIVNRNRNIPHREAIAPSPLLSAFMDDCIERGKEYSIGGARYHIFGTYLTGFANCVDSLAAIRKLVFEEKKYSLAEIAEATRKNYEGYEPLRQYALNRVPKYGNDDDYVDSMANRLLGDFADIIKDEQANHPQDMILGPGIATFEFYAKWGHDVGASADGRKSQEPVASNLSPVQGADLQGPTAAIRSSTAADLLPYFTGGPVDMEIDPDEVRGEQGLIRMVSLIHGFIDLRGLILTITGVSREKLLAAQENPEQYRNLRVRLGGLSAYFVTLSKEMQNSIIERTSHSL